MGQIYLRMEDEKSGLVRKHYAAKGGEDLNQKLMFLKHVLYWEGEVKKLM